MGASTFSPPSLTVVDPSEWKTKPCLNPASSGGEYGDQVRFKGAAFCASEPLLDITLAKSASFWTESGLERRSTEKTEGKMVAHFTTCYPEPSRSSQVSMRVEC